MAGAELPQNRLLELTMGHYVARCIHVAAELGIADVLKDGPKTVTEIASKTGSHPGSLARLMRTLSNYGVFFKGRTAEGSRDGGGDTPSTPLAEERYSLTGMSEFLMSSHPYSLKDVVSLSGSSIIWKSFESLRFTVDTGGEAFPHVFGEPLFTLLARDLDMSQTYDRAMTGFAKNIHFAMLLAYDFSRYKKIVDVGGGRGALLGAILSANKDSHGVLFDQPHVVANAEEIWEKEEVSGRVEIIGGDFFLYIPTGGDLYLATLVLHDWDDESCLKILKNIHNAMPPDGTLVLGEAVVPTDGTPHFSTLMDLTMMVVTSGKERTEQEWRELLDKASFSVNRIINTQSVISIIEATKAAVNVS